MSCLINEKILNVSAEILENFIVFQNVICTEKSRRMSDFPAKEVTCCYTVPLHHVARPRYPGSSLSGGVPQSRVQNQGQSEQGTSGCALQVHVFS